MPNPLAGIDISAIPGTTAATPNKVVERDNNGVGFVANHASLGAAAAVGAAIAADSTGSVPPVALPASLSAAQSLGYDEANSSALNFHYNGAPVILSNGTLFTAPAGILALTNNALNYIQMNPATGAVTANTTGFTTGYYPLFEVTTAAGAIPAANVVDMRPFVNLGTTGVGTPASSGGGSPGDLSILGYWAL